MSHTLLKEILKNKNKVSFHTPGHNNSLPKRLLKCDITELSYSDNLLNPKGVLQELEKTVSCLFGTKRAFLSTNGATNCIHTAIYALKDKGSFLIIGNDAHKAVYNALEITKAKAYQKELLTNEDIEKLPRDIKTLIVTTPNYYGDCIDIEYYDILAKEQDFYLIIDASHGSHFLFGNNFPKPISGYGDLIIHSLHKTLPVPTGGAVLLCNNEKLTNSCQEARILFHSTSPSYMVLVGIEQAISIMQQKGKRLYHKVERAVARLKKKDIGIFQCHQNDDFSRLVLSSYLSGDTVMQLLSEKGLELEMSYDNKIIAIVTPHNYKGLKKLAKELKRISSLELRKASKVERYRSVAPKVEKIEKQDIIEIVFEAQHKWLELENAVGEVSAKQVGIYPPGTPILKSGEIITFAHIKAIKNALDKTFGLEKGKICVISYNNGGKYERVHNDRRL